MTFASGPVVLAVDVPAGSTAAVGPAHASDAARGFNEGQQRKHCRDAYTHSQRACRDACIHLLQRAGAETALPARA